MQPFPVQSSIPRTRRSRLALAAVLFAVGCSGSGSGCGRSCGGAFKTKDAQGNPFVFPQAGKLDNVAQVRVTRSGFGFLNATHLNEIIGALNQGTAGGFTIPCIDAGVLLNACVGSTGFHFTAIAADQNFNNVCDPGEGGKLNLAFKDVSWILDANTNTLRAHIVTHIKTGDIYLHTKEEHSSLCSGNTPIQGRVWIDDEDSTLPQKDTALDLDIQFTTAADGRLELNISDSSLATMLQNFQPGAFFIDGHSGTNPPAPTTGVGVFSGDGCGSSPSSGSYTPSNGSDLACGGLLNGINANCNFGNSNQQGYCKIVEYIRNYLLNFVKNSLRTQIVGILRTQLDARRCQRAVDSQGNAVACNNTNHLCPADDNGTPLDCDTGRGVCVPHGQTPPDPASHNCEPIALGITGELDVSDLTQKVGFPPNTKLDLFAGLGSKTANPQIDSNGLQLSAMAGTKPASTLIGLCVPPAAAPDFAAPPALNFDDGNAKPAGVTGYDVGFSLASALLNRGFYDAYNAGLLCVAITNKTTSFISSGLFKTFLPSLGLVTGGKDVPMMILLRPTQPPYVRIGRNTTKQNPDGSTSPDDPLLTLSFKQLNLDFYALVDERQVRMFTLQADLLLPLGLRTFSDPNTDTLQPVLGSLDQLLTNITALSPQGGAYSAKDMLAEDPGVVKDLLGAAVRLAQPLLAGVLKPIVLPSLLGLRFGVTGLAGAVPLANVAADGYAHLALWTSINECAGTCEQVAAKVDARVVNRVLPDDPEEIRQGSVPMIELEPRATLPHSGARAEFSYRVDGSLWSPWLGVSRLVLRDPLFLVQGHHFIEVTAREAGDDRTMDPQPVGIDFFVSYEAPAVELFQRADGALATRAHSAATREDALLFSYRIDGEQGWSRPGAARTYSAAELKGRGLTVSVSDEAGRSAQAHFGAAEAEVLVQHSAAAGCSTSSRTTSAGLLPLLLAALVWRRRQRKGSTSGA